MIRWTGLAPGEVEFPLPGSLASTFPERVLKKRSRPRNSLLQVALYLPSPNPETRDQVRDADELGHDGHRIRPPTLHRFE